MIFESCLEIIWSINDTRFEFIIKLQEKSSRNVIITIKGIFYLTSSF